MTMTREPEAGAASAPDTPKAGRIRVEECPYRAAVRDDGKERTCCGLVQQILQAEDWRHSKVRRDACEACCALAAPSPIDINPVIASLVYNATDEILEAGGVSGCDSARAASLQGWATIHVTDDSPTPLPVSTPP